MRNLLAGPWLAAWKLARVVLPGGFRILLFHDIPLSQREALARLAGELAQSRRLIDPAEAARLLAGAPLPPGPPPVLLSFDDGFASNLDVAETILAPLGARALFFVCPGLMDLDGAAQSAAIAGQILQGRRAAPEPLMGWDAVERLKALGHTIGSHTLDHRRLAGLAGDQLAEQIGGAAEALAARLGGPVEWFAYTFGAVGDIDAAALAEIGRWHRFCRSGVRGGNSSATPPLALRADHVDLAAGEDWRRLAVEGGLDPLYRSGRRSLDAMAKPR